jgi:hypothetical protein
LIKIAWVVKKRFDSYAAASFLRIVFYKDFAAKAAFTA